MDDFTLIDEDGTRFEIEAFVDDDLQVVAPDDATFIVAVDEAGEQEYFRIHRPTLH